MRFRRAVSAGAASSVAGFTAKVGATTGSIASTAGSASTTPFAAGALSSWAIGKQSGTGCGEAGMGCGEAGMGCGEAGAGSATEGVAGSVPEAGAGSVTAGAATGRRLRRFSAATGLARGCRGVSAFASASSAIGPTVCRNACSYPRDSRASIRGPARRWLSCACSAQASSAHRTGRPSFPEIPAPKPCARFLPALHARQPRAASRHRRACLWAAPIHRVCAGAPPRSAASPPVAAQYLPPPKQASAPSFFPRSAIWIELRSQPYRTYDGKIEI